METRVVLVLLAGLFHVISSSAIQSSRNEEEGEWIGCDI